MHPRDHRSLHQAHHIFLSLNLWSLIVPAGRAPLVEEVASRSFEASFRQIVVCQFSKDLRCCQSRSIAFRAVHDQNVLGPYVQVFDSVTIVVQDSQSTDKICIRGQKSLLLSSSELRVVRKSIWDQRALAQRGCILRGR